MPTLLYEEIVQKICTEKSISPDDVHARVKEKLRELSDLVSKEGAAHIVANELGVRVYDQRVQSRKVKINEITPAMKSVDLTVKVLKVNEIRQYKNAAREGRVTHLLIGDETGTSRLVLWDEKHILQVEKGEIQEGMTIKLGNCYVRENGFGGKEIHMGGQATWTLNPIGEEVAEVKYGLNGVRKSVKDLLENDTVTIFGTVVQIFEPRFYDACALCSKKVVMAEEGFLCPTHGQVKTVAQPVLNVVVDDGTEAIRVICFRDLVKQMLEMDDPTLIRENPEKFREVQRKVAGKQLKIEGKVIRNTFFDRLELRANAFEEADPRMLALELR